MHGGRPVSTARTVYRGSTPDGDLVSNIPLFILRGTCWVCPVIGQERDRESVTPAGNDLTRNLLHEICSRIGNYGEHVFLRRYLVGVYHFLNTLDRRINRLHVHVDDILALLPVGFHNGFLDELNGPVLRNNAGNHEECSLHDGVDAGTKPQFLGNIHRIDNVKGAVLLNNLLLHLSGQLIPHLILREG
jgi:hypothetical protein